MSRIARLVAPGYPHHVIQRGNNRQTVFYDDEDRKTYLCLLREYSAECSCRIHAYCLMDNHVHALFVPEYIHSLGKAMQKLSLRYTQHINGKYQRTGRLWECRFHSALVDKESYLWTVCRYIERNPVRASIVNEPSLYKWSSARVSTSQDSDGFIEPIWHNQTERRAYVEFLCKTDNEKETEIIRKSISTGKPVGTEEFSSSVEKMFGIALAPGRRGRPRNTRMPD